MVIEGGHQYKDLSYLNRDLKSIVVVETDPNAVKKHRENAIIVDEFTGNTNDKVLQDLLPLLERKSIVNNERLGNALSKRCERGIAKNGDRPNLNL